MFGDGSVGKLGRQTEGTLKLSAKRVKPGDINLGERLCCKEVNFVSENDTQNWLTSKHTHTHKKISLRGWTCMAISALHRGPVLTSAACRGLD